MGLFFRGDDSDFVVFAVVFNWADGSDVAVGDVFVEDELGGCVVLDGRVG